MTDKYPASVRELSRLLQEATMQSDGPEAEGDSAYYGEELSGQLTADGTVSLSQILERPVPAALFEVPAKCAPTLAPRGHSGPAPAAVMGNGTSGHHHVHPANHHVGSGSRTPVTYPEDYSYLKNLVTDLKDELKERDFKVEQLEAEALNLRRQLKKKNEDLNRLDQEVHKLKCVLQQRAASGQLNEQSDFLAVLQGPVAGLTSKKQGVSGESCFHNKTSQKIFIQRYDKDFRSKQLIKDAILDNDLLKHLESSQVKEIVDSMYSQEFQDGSWVIREGDVGSHLYVSAVGEMDVIKNGEVLGRLTPGKAFGELAILYNCTRTASIKAITPAKVWVLDRRVFQQIMMQTGMKRMEDNITFLSSMPLLRGLHNDHLTKIADALEVDFFNPGTYIIRQGTSGDSFYIIKTGKVKVTQRIPGKNEEEQIRILEKGSYFGEQALLREECRTANVVAIAPGVECLTLDRQSFIQLIGDLSELKEKDYGDEVRGVARPITTPPHNVDADKEYSFVRLDDLEVIATLGVGGFGRVELVRFLPDRSKTFALKCLKKQHIVETQQQEHIFSEKQIMLTVRNPFIAKLFKTFRDNKYVYMLMEACLGGEVWSILRDRGWFDDVTARFYTACVIEALEYLHNKNIIYRDLKPENLLLDCKGYAKLVDFGFSKRLSGGSRTWTFCGTPEYVAPEIILNKGHDKAVDYWSIGILMYELLTGTPPFTASDPMKTYNIILKGIGMVEFPSHVSHSAIALIKRLCRHTPNERLGYQKGGILDIKKHRWFQGFDWDGIRARTLLPPICPKVRSPSDASNFDSYPRDTDVPPDEFSGWDIDF